MNLFELGLATEEKPVDREKLEKERKLQEAVLQIKGKYATRIIGFLAPLSLATFLIHANPLIEKWFSSLDFHTYWESIHYSMQFLFHQWHYVFFLYVVFWNFLKINYSMF